jgi:hypothetical protein
MKTIVEQEFIPGQLTLSCPFFEASNQDCQVSCVTTRTTATQQLCYCETEDYDNCPLFLCQVLRNSRQKFRGVMDLEFK